MRIQPSPIAPPSPANPSEAKLREAAMDFEALLIAQVLHSFRGETETGGLGGESASSSATMMEFAEQHLSHVISRQGGLGLHELIVQGLLRSESSAAATQTPSGDGIVPPAGK